MLSNRLRANLNKMLAKFCCSAVCCESCALACVIAMLRNRKHLERTTKDALEVLNSAEDAKAERKNQVGHECSSPASTSSPDASFRACERNVSRDLRIRSLAPGARLVEVMEAAALDLCVMPRRLR